MSKSKSPQLPADRVASEVKPAVKAKEIIVAEFDSISASDTSARSYIESLPKNVVEDLQAVITSKELSYRDALAVQLAFWLANERPTDVTVRHEGGRGVAGWFGEYLAGKHIRAVKDALQNVGKNSVALTRGNQKNFDQTLVWASDNLRTKVEISAAFRVLCWAIAGTARAVVPLPKLNRGALTYAKVCGLLAHLYAMPSGGAFEQFSIAGLLHAVIELQGVPGYRVETKNLNASDKSSRTAGDIQILVGNRVVEALEVTANDWREKLANAAKTIRDNDLSRLTVVAGGVLSSGDALFQELADLPHDVSVIDVRSLAFSLVAALTRQGRATAISRIYELLDRYQPDTKIVNQFVESLKTRAMVETTD